MRDKTKKFLGLILATVTLSSAFAGCGAGKYKGDPVDGFVPTTTPAISNGGFAVQNGDYIYFINGYVGSDADNTFGTPVKQSIVRVKLKADGTPAEIFENPQNDRLKAFLSNTLK